MYGAQTETLEPPGLSAGLGLVVAEPVGRRVRYELSDTKLAHALEDLLAVILTVDPICSCPIEE
ncbi:hypothetical protein [Paenarthrobacter sp. PH39-S1]|uniref:hypothetical protein n=1 Tax=Paenarthrobacter sp. PH39-S1 TaxID=3046204 RepID=UPI0032D925C5